jgi:hypothetical protein
MDVAFDTPRLRLVCESDTEARRYYPASTVAQLRSRLADLRAAMSAADLLITRASLDPQPPACVRFLLDEGYELVCVDSHPNPHLGTDGLVDFERMRRVKVVKFGRTRRHG